MRRAYVRTSDGGSSVMRSARWNLFVLDGLRTPMQQAVAPEHRQAKSLRETCQELKASEACTV